MCRHKQPIIDLDMLDDSTYYYWRTRLSKLVQLCIYAAWRKARKEDPNLILTKEAIFGESGFAGGIYRDKRTDEMIVSFENPGSAFEEYGSRSMASRTIYEARKGSQLMTGIELTGWSVHKVLDGELGKNAIDEILRVLPFFGKFQSHDLLFTQGMSEDERRLIVLEAGYHIRGEEERSLRTLRRDKVNPLDHHGYLVYEAQYAMDNKAVRAAVNVLEGRSAMIPEKYKPQRELFKIA